MLDPNTKSIFEVEAVDSSIVNKRKRTALMLCFTSPHFTMVAKEFGLEKDEETGLAIPRAKRPQTAQVRKIVLCATFHTVRDGCSCILSE